MDVGTIADALDRQLKMINIRKNIVYRKNVIMVKFDERIDSLKKTLNSLK